MPQKIITLGITLGITVEYISPLYSAADNMM